jgi:O-antigen ligase
VTRTAHRQATRPAHGAPPARSRWWRAAPALAVPTVLLAAALTRLAPQVVGPVATLVVLAAGVCAAVLLLQASPTVLLSGAVVLQVFSSNWVHLGIPLGLDRVLFAATVVALVRDRVLHRIDLRQPWTSVHSVLAALVVWALCSALFAGTLMTVNGAFALLDRLGLVPFAAFALAPVLFRTRAQANALLVAFVCLGVYLGLTALFEGVGLRQLVVPGYIADPTVGIHAERARGPFVEAVANGLGLYLCAVVSFVALRVWRTRWARTAAATVMLLCLAGTVFTLTRAVWLAVVVATVVALAGQRETRRLVLPSLAVGAVVVVCTLAVVPGLSEQVSTRATQQQPVWDRYNTNLAALRIVEDRALTGIGWQRFTDDGPAYLRQADAYPITGTGIEVHNVPLSHAAELGVPGAAMYLLALALALARGLRRGLPPELVPYRTALVAIAVAWAVVASFGPLSYAFPNTVLWLWLGLAGALPRRSGPSAGRSERAHAGPPSAAGGPA